MYQQQKRYKSANDSLSDFSLWHGVVIKVENDWRGVGRPHVSSLFISLHI